MIFGDSDGVLYCEREYLDRYRKLTYMFAMNFSKSNRTQRDHLTDVSCELCLLIIAKLFIS